MIPTRQLPHGLLALSELSLGCSPLGNMYREVSTADARSTVDVSWELGRTGHPPPGLGLHRDGIRRSLEESLERVGLDRLDIVYLHDPDEHWTEVLATGYAALEELRAEGIVAAIGAGMNQSKMLVDLVRETDVDAVMLAGRYTLLDQGALDELLPLCFERRVAVVAAGVFNSDLLARAYPGGDARYDYGDAPRELVERAHAIARICGRHGTTLPAAALAFPLAHRAVASVCVGARTAAQMQSNAALHADAIAPDLWSELKAERLVRGDAPVPD